MAESLDRVWREREIAGNRLAEVERESARRDEEAAARLALSAAEARAEAARIVADAEGEALRIRHAIGSRMAEATARLDELLGVRESLLDDLRALVADYEQMVAKLERGSARVAPADAEPALAREEQPAMLFPRRVDVNAGPFDDFAELSSFERSLARLPAVEDVYIRSFAAHQAQIELTLAQERPLLRDLVTHVPYDIHVSAAGESSVSVDLRGAVAG